MKKKLTFLMVLFISSALAGCTTMMADDIAGQSAFNPYITKDGQQSFRFVAQNRLPSYYQDADVQDTHEQWIANELGQRQYCPEGFEIVSKEKAGGMLIYEGVCN